MKNKQQKTALNIRIDEPCHESWDKMSQEKDGRFCFSCSKTVIDFTPMTDSQLMTYFNQPPTGSICGRFKNSQLSQPAQSKLTYHSVFMKRIAAAFLAGFSFLIMACNRQSTTDENIAPIQDNFNEESGQTLGSVYNEAESEIKKDTAPKNNNSKSKANIIKHEIKGEISVQEPDPQPEENSILVGVMAYPDPEIEPIIKDSTTKHNSQ